MRLEDYTADAICRAMSLPGFIEPPWEQSESPILRVLLTPSFHPELCVTLSRNSEAVLLSAITLTKQFWRESTEVYLPHEREDEHVPPTSFDKALALFAIAHAAVNPQGPYFYIDGMGSESCLVSRAGARRFRTHVPDLANVGNPAKQFVALVIEIAWNTCRQPGIRNALAQAASYLGIEYPVQDVPAEPPRIHLAVLGAPQERDDFLEMLREAKKAKTS